MVEIDRFPQLLRVRSQKSGNSRILLRDVSQVSLGPLFLKQLNEASHLKATDAMRRK